MIKMDIFRTSLITLGLHPRIFKQHKKFEVERRGFLFG
jgi:hypothetical protein